jgi:signal transduction histidine kinase
MLLVQIGAIIEVLLFSAAFGLKMRQIEKDRRTNEQIRENISSDLHDEIGSTLSSIAILSEALQKKTEQGDNHQSIGVITERTRQVMDTMSDIVWSINPMNDEMAIVLLKMREFAAETLEAKEIVLHFHTDDVLPALRLSIEQRKDFYLFFKEAINNAAKYAQASQIWIKIYKFNQGIQLEIQDNGKGFDATQTIPGNGLQNMRERTQRMRGRMELDTLPGMGTRIKLFIPLE